MKKKFLKKYSIILCAGVVIISAIELSGNVGNHASAEMISQNVTDTGFTTVSGTVNTKPVITAGGLTGSKTVSGTAAPGAIVDFCYGTSGKVTVTADEKGNWTANLTTGLTAGNIYAWSALNGQNWIESDLVTVKQDQTSLKVKDLTYHVGDKIDLRDGFVSMTDQDGNTTTTLPGNTSFNDPNGLHDNVPGVYEITYVHDGITAISHVTLLPMANTKPVITAGGFTGSKTVSGTATPGATVDFYTTSGKVTR